METLRSMLVLIKGLEQFRVFRGDWEQQTWAPSECLVLGVAGRERIGCEGIGCSRVVSSCSSV